MVAVPKAWGGQTVVCLATGPSLTQEDCDFVRGRARVIGINNAYMLAPWADALYGTDARWWHWHHGVPSFTGAKWSMDHSQWSPVRTLYPDVQCLQNMGPDGLSHDPRGLKNGRNSGYACINLAYLYGAKRIVLLGYDMQAAGSGPSHFFGEHPNGQRSPYDIFRRRFESLVRPLKKRQVEVINCTRRTALTVFPTARLEDVLVEVAA